MKSIPMRPQMRKPFRLAKRQPDLFAWAASRITDPPPPLPYAVAYLARRYGLSQTFAALAALHSGLGDLS